MLNTFFEREKRENYAKDAKNVKPEDEFFAAFAFKRISLDCKEK